MTMGQAMAGRGNAQVELGGEIERLADFVSRERLPLRMAVEIAAVVAENLAHLHGQRRAHGGVAERNILVCDGQGWLAPPDRSHAGAAVADDVRQFGDLCRALLARTGDPAASEVAHEIDAMLERVPARSAAETMPAVHGAGRQMKRVALGLKVLRARVSQSGPVAVERVAEAPVAVAEPVAEVSGRRVVMMFRAVEEDEESPAAVVAPRRGGLFGLPWYVVLVGAALGTSLAWLVMSALR